MNISPSDSFHIQPSIDQKFYLDHKLLELPVLQSNVIERVSLIDDIKGGQISVFYWTSTKLITLLFIMSWSQLSPTLVLCA